MFSAKRFVVAVVATISLSGYITTSMQGYADRELPAKPVSRIVAYVAGPGPLASRIQSSISEEARKSGVIAQDALRLFPPTRSYTNAEIRQGLASKGSDGGSSSMSAIRGSCSSTPARSSQGNIPDPRMLAA
jgi:hypothetical protein